MKGRYSEKIIIIQDPTLHKVPLNIILLLSRYQYLYVYLVKIDNIG